jgi:hypothetical protein
LESENADMLMESESDSDSDSKVVVVMSSRQTVNQRIRVYFDLIFLGTQSNVSKHVLTYTHTHTLSRLFVF